MTRSVLPLQPLSQDIIGWATATMAWYELFINRIKNLQLNYCDRCEAKFAAFFPNHQDAATRWTLFLESAWWQRFHRLHQRLQTDYDQFVKICLDARIPIPAFHPLRSGSIVPQEFEGRLGFTTIQHQFSRAPSTESFRYILASFFQI